MKITFGSVCSGIEAASVAWNPLGWEAAWFAEIEPFPCRLLAHHYPSVTNLGDMTAIADKILAGTIPAPDILCGGTPCQAFSVAGKRNSLGDSRGQLSLEFCRIADAIDSVRPDRPCTVFWENVPGCLSTADNAFGCFLGRLAGEDCELQPSGGRWSNAGAVFGPKRAVAWRVLDAQYFGLAQRRKRVFVVASAGGIDPTKVLFESEGVRRDSPPCRKKGQGFAADVAPGIGASGRGFDRAGETRGQDPVVAFHPTQDPISSTDGTTHGLGCGSSKGQASVAVAFALQAGTTRENPSSGPGGVGIQEQLAYTIEARAEVQAVAFGGDIARSLTARHDSSPCADRGMDVVAIAFKPGQSAAARTIGAQEDIACTLEAGGGGNNKQAVAYPIDLRNATRSPDKHDAQNRQGCGLGEDGDPAPTLTKEFTPGVCCADLSPTVLNGLPFSRTGNERVECDAIVAQPFDVANCLTQRMHKGITTTVDEGQTPVLQGMQVRRLTPTECERLQGFPDGYTAIPKAADGPRYKALGNSWAVPVVRWIGERIDRQPLGLGDRVSEGREMSAPITAADLFCGAGGTSTGLMAAADKIGRRAEYSKNDGRRCLNATEMINHLDSRVEALKVEDDRLKAANADLLKALEYAAEIIEQEIGASSESAMSARAAMAKGKEAAV